jgi:hypothetical protein
MSRLKYDETGFFRFNKTLVAPMIKEMESKTIAIYPETSVIKVIKSFFGQTMWRIIPTKIVTEAKGK